MAGEAATLSPLARRLTYLVAVLFALLGTLLFLLPGWASANFAWNVSPFVTMTMGGWCLGNAYIAWESARLWRWSLVYPALLYLWLFGILEALVLVVFRARLSLAGLPAWLYIATLIANVLMAVVGIMDWVRLRPALRPEGGAIRGWVRGGIVFFVVVVLFLAVGGAIAQPGGLSTEGGVFPERLSLFTVRAFAAFFGALSLAAVPLLRARGIGPVLVYGRTGLALIVPILLAAAVHIRAFDFARRPGGIGYLVAYIGTFIYTVAVLRSYGGGRSPGEPTPPL